MKFQPNHQPPPYLNRRDQYRLLAMVGVLCLLMVAIQLAAKPSSWHWLVPPDEQRAGPVPGLEEIDFRVQPQEDTALAADTFRVVESGEQDRDKSDENESRANNFEIPGDVLSPIEDNTVGLRRKEAGAYRLMLTRIDSLSEDMVAAESKHDVAFTVLMLQPDDHRGRLLTVVGDLRRLTEFPVPQESEFDTLYEGWLFTRDSGTNPYRVVFTRQPVGMPLGESLDPPVRVRVTGYFFKRYGYASQGGQHVAPLLLAKSPKIVPAPAVAPVDGPELRNLMLGTFGIVALAFAGLAGWFFLSDRRYRSSRLSELAAARLNATPESLAALKEVPIVDPNRPFDDEATETSSTVS